MSSNQPFFHLFRTRNNHYIYDVNKDLFVKVPSKTYENLKVTKGLSDNNYASEAWDDDVLNKLKEQGFLSCNRAEEIINPVDESIESYINNAVTMITLQITQQCNLRCSYCTYSGNYLNRTHSNKEMELETAKKGIDLLIRNSKGLDSVNVGFYGGEPLLRLDFIKECISYAKKIGEGKLITFSMTTNGTVFTDEAISFLSENNIDILISLDGPKEIHNKNRKFINGAGTFEKIMTNVEHIRELYPEYLKKHISFNIVLDGTNSFSCINDFFTDYESIKDLRVNSSLINDMYTNKTPEISDTFIAETGYEKFKSLLSKVGRLDSKYTSKIFEKDLVKLREKFHEQRIPQHKIPKKVHHGGPCIPGVTRLFVSTEGILYPCERVSEASEVMKIGDVETGFNIEKIRGLLNIGRLTAEKCKNCWAFRYCYMCAAFADTLEGLSGERKLMFCSEVQSSVESLFVLYCTLKEYGYNFDEKAINREFATIV